MLNDKQITKLAEEFDWSNNKCFAEWFQKYGKESLSIRQLQQAYTNSQEFFDIEMIPFVQSNVNKLSKQIFITDGWMFQNPKVATEELTSKRYLIGGRHRLFAITDVLGKIGSYTGIGEQIFEQKVRVELLEGVKKEYIPDLILSDNGSRRVSKPERSSMIVHKYSPTPAEDDFIRAALTSGFTLPQAIQTVAPYFLKIKQLRELDSRKAYAIGTLLTRYLLIGGMHKPITKKTQILIGSIREFVEKANLLWGCVERAAQQDKHLLAEQIASKAVQMYEREMNP